jgi:hypothetical protein
MGAVRLVATKEGLASASGSGKRVAVLHRKVRERRKDLLHQISHQLTAFPWFCQDSRQAAFWRVTTAADRVTPLLTGADGDAMLGLRFGGCDGAAGAHGSRISPVPLPRVRQAI